VNDLALGSGLLLAAGSWTWLATLNAVLNGTATVLLIAGYWLIKRGHERAHIRVMLSAFGVSVVFLASYLLYHAFEGSVRFPATAPLFARIIYYTILISHVILAAAVPVLALLTIYRGWKDQREQHRKIARWTFPIWLYVSITGVVIYIMLYHLFPPVPAGP